MILFALLVTILTIQADEFAQLRGRMVSRQIEARGVKDKTVLEAIRNVPRHLFVPENMRDEAYRDGPLPIGYGQTISQPYIVAYMTEILEPDSSDVVLEIGTGSGYQAAVLAEIVSEVYTIEIIAELAPDLAAVEKLYDAGAARLWNLGYDNVTVMRADGYHGWPVHAPFDAIIVTAAAEHIPPPLIEQLKDGGKMIIPVGSRFDVQYLMLVEKEDGFVKTQSLMPVRFVPFTRRK